MAPNGRGFHVKTASNSAPITALFSLPVFGMEFRGSGLIQQNFSTWFSKPLRAFQRMVLSILDTETASKITMKATARISPMEIGLNRAVKPQQQSGVAVFLIVTLIILLFALDVADVFILVPEFCILRVSVTLCRVQHCTNRRRYRIRHTMDPAQSRLLL